jgi:hypothetical protein
MLAILSLSKFGSIELILTDHKMLLTTKIFSPQDVKKNDWPSDHYAVVSKLEWIEKKFDLEEKTDEQE